MKVITRYCRIYAHFWQLAFSQGSVYRVDTILLFVAVVLYLIQSFTFSSTLLSSIPLVGGWNFSQYSILLATYSLNWGIFKMFYGRTMEDVVDKIFTGQMDYFLLRPINHRFLCYFCPPLIKSFPSVIFNLFFLVWLLYRFSVPITTWSLSLYIFYLLIGQIIIFSFAQTAVSTAFFTSDASEIFPIFENAWNQANYPDDAFNQSVRNFITFVIPIALFSSFPAKVLLHRVQFGYEYFIPIIVAAVCLLVSNIIYHRGVKNYTSAGG